MRKGIHGVGRRCLQRIVSNGGNRLFIKGGKVKVLIAAPSLTPLQKAVLIAAILTPNPPDTQGAGSQQVLKAKPERADATAAMASPAVIRKRKGASDDV